MEKQKVPTLKPYKGCKHKLSLPLYARGEKNWISTQKISGKMTYVCIKCGAFLDKGFVERKDALCEENVGGSK